MYTNTLFLFAVYISDAICSYLVTVPSESNMKLIKKSCLGLMLAGLIIPSFASADIVTNLQEYWAMDGDTTSNSGTHDGTFVSNDGAGANYASGQFGQGIDLERGNGEYLDIQNSVTDFDHIGGSITVSAWVNFEDNPSNWQAVITNGEESAWRMATGRNADQVQPFWTAGAPRNDIGSGGTEFAVEDPDFHLLVGTYDGETNISNFYVDGVLVATSDEGTGLGDNASGMDAAAGPTEDNPEPGPALGITIGTNSDERDRNFDGIIDDVGIWDAALTQEEVDMLWNGGAGMSIASIVGGATPAPAGDFDGDGDVDCDDLDGYIGNIGADATGMLAALDFDGNGTLTSEDADMVIAQSVTTSNGVTGTFPGDVNCDGSVNVLGDAFALVGSLGGSATMYSQGDVNFDGIVNVLGDAFVLVGNLGMNNAAP